MSVKYLIISRGPCEDPSGPEGGRCTESRRQSTELAIGRSAGAFPLRARRSALCPRPRSPWSRATREPGDDHRGRSRARGAAHGQRLPDRARRRRPDPSRPLRARHPRAHGDERRMRHVVVRRMHRAPRRPIGEVVHGARGAGARPRGHDDRGARRRRHAAPDAAGVPDPPRAAVRVLHARDGHGRGLAGDRARRPRGRRRPHRARGQPLPLYRVPEHRRRGRRRRPGHADRERARGARHRHDPGTVLVRPRPLGRRSAGCAAPSTATTPSSSPAAIRCCP